MSDTSTGKYFVLLIDKLKIMLLTESKKKKNKQMWSCRCLEDGTWSVCCGAKFTFISQQPKFIWGIHLKTKVNAPEMLNQEVPLQKN